MKFLKLVVECIKEARQTKRDIKTIRNLDVCYDALQHLVNTVAFGSNPVEIELTMANGSKLLIKRQEMNGTGYESFKDRVEKARANRAL